tara:strand:+ start:405 stop:548 length:144 start_codon:yes stop_codon:yes gene_type:complete
MVVLVMPFTLLITVVVEVVHLQLVEMVTLAMLELVALELHHLLVALQ